MHLKRCYNSLSNTMRHKKRLFSINHYSWLNNPKKMRRDLKKRGAGANKCQPNADLRYITEQSTGGKNLHNIVLYLKNCHKYNHQRLLISKFLRKFLFYLLFATYAFRITIQHSLATHCPISGKENLATHCGLYSTPIFYVNFDKW